MLRKRLLVVACVAALLSVPSRAEAQAPPALTAKNEDARRVYRQGHQALNRERWIPAYESFQELERILRGAKETADVALYWQAYSLSRAGRTRQAKGIAERLVDQYPQSPWRDDARRLIGAEASMPAGAQADEEEVMMVLNALMSSSSPRASPLLLKVLDGDYSERVKARALFVLTQIDARAADDALARILKAPGTMKLKKSAIRMVASGGNRASLDRLDAVYESDPALRTAVIRAWLIGDRKTLLLRAAKGERDPSVRRRAIEALGATNGRKELLELFRARTEPDVQRDVIRGLAVAGAAEALGEIARTSSSPKMRTAAIRALGTAGGADVLRALAESSTTSEERAAAIRAMGIVGGGKPTRDAIASWYRRGDKTVRRAVLNALTASNGVEQLIELFRAEKDRRQKRRLLQRIVTLDSDFALDLLESDVNKEDR